MQYKIPPGVFDIIPQDDRTPWKSSFLWNYVEKQIRQVTKEFGYQEIRTPMFERTELFQRGVGETSDIVSKEMYTFNDKGNRSLSLRPEGTTPVLRAFVENNLANQGSVHKLFYIAPMFRYERAQAGRYRQHHQFGVEAIGNCAPEQDVEVIDLVYTLYNRLGLKNLSVCINTLGDVPSRIKFREELKKYLSQFKDQLSEDSLKRLEVNPLRILDSKNPVDQEIVKNAPSIFDFLTDDAKKHFEKVQELLTEIQIPFQISDQLVRGLDYYNHTVFEIVSGNLGAQNSVAGGGRYDGLIKNLGGPDLPAIGFGSGIERVIQTMLNQMVTLPKIAGPTIFFIPLGEKAKTTCFKILHQLRENQIAAQMDFTGRKLNKVMQYTNQIRAQYVAVIGDAELESREVQLKEMSSGKVFKAPLDQLAKIMRIEGKQQVFQELIDDLSLPFEDPREEALVKQQLTALNQEPKNCSKQLENALINIKKLISSRD